MAVYLIGFSLSVAIMAFAQKRKTPLFVLLSAIALLIPCLIAGLRAADIGTDVTVYLKQLTQSAIQSNSYTQYRNTYWFSSWRNHYVSSYEVGFSALVYVVAKIGGSLYAVQFVVQALTITPIYIALARNRKQMPVWLGMLIYYLFFFNATLNVMRQWVAMALLLLAFQMLREKKWIAMTTLTCLAIPFHYSSVIVLIIYAICWAMHLCRKTTLAHNGIQMNAKTLLALTIFVVSLAVILNLKLVLKIFEIVGFTRFSNYLEGEPISLLIGQVALRLPLIALFLLNWKHLRKRTPLAAFYLCLLLLDLVAAQLISVDVYAFRINYFFTIYLILAIPELCASIPCRVKRTTTIALFIVYFLFYWYYTYILQLRHETYPYLFM